MFVKTSTFHAIDTRYLALYSHTLLINNTTRRLNPRSRIKPYVARIPRKDAYREATLLLTRSDDDHNGAYRRFSLGMGQLSGPYGPTDLSYDGSTGRLPRILFLD
ncbi:unnamed protein product [Rhizoctonia solani]|uniref:Uncharacterized protein n=1 Tax=Rhizoctonia solani TaxID=456999 RepID=A0A8H3BW53_9AGAM|nr:unnamed protein product [Rhizoctonia solani]